MNGILPGGLRTVRGALGADHQVLFSRSRYAMIRLMLLAVGLRRRERGR